MRDFGMMTKPGLGRLWVCWEGFCVSATGIGEDEQRSDPGRPEQAWCDSAALDPRERHDETRSATGWGQPLRGPSDPLASCYRGRPPTEIPMSLLALIDVAVFAVPPVPTGWRPCTR